MIVLAKHLPSPLGGGIHLRKHSYPYVIVTLPTAFFQLIIAKIEVSFDNFVKLIFKQANFASEGIILPLARSCL